MALGNTAQETAHHPVVAAALKNKEVVIPGMIIGVIGYAIGNYLGVAIAYLLK